MSQRPAAPTAGRRKPRPGGKPGQERAALPAQKGAVMDYRFDPKLPTLCAHWEQEQIELWEFTVDTHGRTWLWPALHPEPGAHVHCGKVGERGEGYGGHTLRFPTLAGGIELVGPWHSNSDSLYECAGVDLRGKHRTWGVVAEKISWSTGECRGALHVDPPDGVVGRFDRVLKIAQQLQKSHPAQLMYYSKSRGGCSCGPVPEGT